MPRFRLPSPAMCVALLGLSVALGGTTWAAASLPERSVGTPQLKQNAVTGDKVENHSLTGADLDLTRVGIVRSAQRAKTADLATRATLADAAGTAYSTHFETGIALTKTPAAVATLPLPAGSYVLTAKGQVDTNTAGDIVECDLVAGTAKDMSFVQGGASHQSQIAANSLVYSSPSAGTASLVCAGVAGSTSLLSQVRVTAIQVGSISNTP
jgi:hypothetical protein